MTMILHTIRLTIVCARLVLWFGLASGILEIQVGHDEAWFMDFAITASLHALSDARYIAVCQLNIEAEFGFLDMLHIFLTLVDERYLTSVRWNRRQLFSSSHCLSS